MNTWNLETEYFFRSGSVQRENKPLAHQWLRYLAEKYRLPGWIVREVAQNSRPKKIKTNRLLACLLAIVEFSGFGF